MDITLGQLLSLNDSDKKDLLMPYILKKTINLEFINIDNEQVYQLLLKYLNNSNIPKDKVLDNKIINYVIKDVLKKVIGNTIVNDFKNVTTSFINKYFNSSEMYNLNKLMNFYEKYDVILTTNNLEELLNDNKINNAVEYIFNKYEKSIEENGLDEITDNNYLIDLLNLYATKNDITIKDNLYNLNSYLVDESKEAVSTLRSYLNELGNYPILTHEQEISLGKRIMENDEEALNTMIKCNLRLVVSIAKRYKRQSVSLMDIIQDGNLGLMIAAKRYDYRMGYRFSTYAVHWIKQSIRRGLAEKEKLIRKPVNMIGKINKISYYQSQFANENGREPTIEEIANHLNISEKTVDEILYYSIDPISLSTFVGEEEESTLEDFIESDAASPEEEAINSIIKDNIDSLLSTLNEREQDVIKRRFGFDNMECQTLEEIGEHFGVTRERIRQIEAKALKRLRIRARTNDMFDNNKKY